MNITTKTIRQKARACALVALGCSVSIDASSMSLNEAIRAAYSYVPAIAAQQEFINASEQQVNVVKSGQRPSVVLDAAKTYGWYDNASTRIAGFTDYEEDGSHRVDLRVTQRLYDQGSTRGQINSAQRLYDAEVLSLAERKEAVAVDVISAYIDVLRHRELWIVAQNNVSIGQNLAGIIGKQVELGRSAEVDQHLANSQLAVLRAQQDFQYGLLYEAHIRFYELTGLDSEQVEQIDPLSNFPGMNAMQDGQLMGQLLLQRPDIMAAQARVEAARERVKSQQGDLLPKIDLELFAGVGEDEDYVLGDNDNYGASLNFSWDLYNGGANRAEIARDRSELNAVMKEQEELQRIARRDIQSALVGLAATEKQLSFIKTEETANQAVYEAYQQQLISGRRSPLDVFVVLNNYNQSKLKAIDTQYRVIAEQYEAAASFGQLNEILGL